MQVANRISVLLAIMTLSIGLLGCRASLRDSEYTTKPPSTFDLVGTWLPDAATLKEMRTRGHYEKAAEPQMVLREDGTFDLFNMPDWWNNGEGQSSGRFDHYSGNWRTSQGGTGLWQLVLYSTAGIRPVDLLGQAPPYRVSFTIGDPDDQLWMVFSRNQTSSSAYH